MDMENIHKGHRERLKERFDEHGLAPFSDVEALEEQVLADWIKKHNLSQDTHFYSFQYYGTDNGYHIIIFNLSQFSFGVTNDVDIAGCTFQGLGYEDNLVAYKNGMFIQLYSFFHRLYSQGVP